jgi:hypothetical protein
MQPFREAGLPRLRSDSGGEQSRYDIRKGVVRQRYPDTWRVDIEPEEGGLIRLAMVAGDTLPPVHEDTETPSHVLFGFFRGNVHDPWCLPLPFRRLRGPETADTGDPGDFYSRNDQIQRVNDITIRITPDNEIWMSGESGDFIRYDQKTREIRLRAPHVVVGMPDAPDGTRSEYHQNTVMQWVIPQFVLGGTGQPDADGLTYLANLLLHAVSPTVDLTAAQLVRAAAPLIELLSTQVYLGGLGDTEPAVMGGALQLLWTAMKAVFDAHVHSGVSTGPGVSAVPTTQVPLMDMTQQSTVVHVSKNGV